jgi:cyclic pyranopterin phosphate synthase
LLSVDEIGRIVSILTRNGINRIRLTGGEPLLRPELSEIVKNIRKCGARIDISMTTNGHGLAEKAHALKEAGLNRVNISLDSIKSENYARLTGGGPLNPVMRAIDASLAAGLDPVKINVVLIKGVNDDEVEDMIGLARERQLQVRFIELMPLSEMGRQPEYQMCAESIIKQLPALQKLPDPDRSQPAELYSLPGFAGKIGLIRPMSHKFCNDCNRIRITSDGMVKSCLGENSEISLLPALAGSDKMLEETLLEAVSRKPRGHNFDNNFASERGMNRIGG